MVGVQSVTASAVRVVLIALLAVIVWRRRLSQCQSLPLYLVAALAGNLLVTLWPARFYTSWFFVYKQAAYDLLKMAIALELAYRALRSFPGAWRTARLALLLVLASSTLMLALLTPRSSYERIWEWQPAVVTAGVWLITTTALLVVWYRVPVRDWQRAILLGLAPYQIVSVTLIDLLRRSGWGLRVEVGLLGSLAFLALLLYWTWAALRRDEASDRKMDDLDRLARAA